MEYQSALPKPLIVGGYGVVVLPYPQKYYIYNGPTYQKLDGYQKALLDATNWYGNDYRTNSPTMAPSFTAPLDFPKTIKSSSAYSCSSAMIALTCLLVSFLH